MHVKHMNLYSHETASVRLDSIYHAVRELNFSKSMATTIIGSRAKLEELVARGYVRMEKPTGHQHGKWLCNASDVLRYAASMMD